MSNLDIQRATAIGFVLINTAASAFAVPAVTLYDSGGFESSTRFATSTALEGQDPTFGPWLTTKNVSTDTAKVQAGVGVGGTNGVILKVPAGQAGIGSVQQWFVTKAVAPAAPYDNIVSSWDMNVTHTSTTGLDYGPFFGEEFFDASGSTIKQVAGFGVDASTGDLLILTNVGGTAFYDFPTVETVVTLGQYHSFSVDLDYTHKTYSVLLNGAVIQSGIPFFDQTATAFTDADISTEFVSNDHQQTLSQGTAYFDDYVLSAVPEPASIATISLISVGMLKRRR